MVDLPRHVRGRLNPIGRMYFSYEKGRGTPSAWPPMPLPFDPQDDEFWRRCRQCQRLHAGRAGEAWAWFWLGQGNRRHALPPPRGEGGPAAFWRAVDAAAERDRSADGEARRTFDAPIDLYGASGLHEARGTHEARLRPAPAGNPAGLGRRPGVQTHCSHCPGCDRSARQHASRRPLLPIGTVEAARLRRAARVLRHQRRAHYREDRARGRAPHPLDRLGFRSLLRARAVGLHLPVYSALYTGQRSVNVVPIARPAKGANAVELIARKTGAAVYVPIHSEYREILERTHIDHAALHLREDGEPWTLAAYRTAWQGDLTSVNAKGQPTSASPAKKAAMARLREGGFVFHGLRKNAVNMLLKAGNTEAEVSAIIEMSEQMVRHYSRDVNKRRIAVNGMRKLEEVGKET